MPFESRASTGCAKMRTTLSSWTPLNHSLSNKKIFEERRNLLSKWFDRWSDSQKRAVLHDFVLSCSVEQLMALSLSMSRQLPLQAADFTCLLPRALSLYIFSFLDPRSLCRCAQVSWHWRSIVELDQLWMPKCLRLGWCINFSPTPFEQGIWKMHYIQSVQELRIKMLQTASSQQQHHVVPHVCSCSSTPVDQLDEPDEPDEPVLLKEESPASSPQPQGGTYRKKQPTTPPPWRVSDRRPTDTVRFNYLDNMDPNEQAAYMKTKGSASTWSMKTISDTNYKLRKAKSLMFLSSNCRPQKPHPLPDAPPPVHPPSTASPFPQHQHQQTQTQTRPSWASCSQEPPVTIETAKTVLRLARWNARIRPAPVRTAVPRLSIEALRATRRSQRSAPSRPVFEAQPWTVLHHHLHQETAASGR